MDKSAEETNTSKEKHSFKAAHKISEEVVHKQEQKLKDIQEQMKEFKWADEEKNGYASQPEVDQPEVNSCIERIVDYVSCHLGLDDMSYSENEATLLSCSVPISVHSLLASRFDNRYSFESRIEQFDKVRNSFADACLHSDLKKQLDKQVMELLPTVGNIQGTTSSNIAIPSHTVTPSSAWEVVDARLDDDDELIMGDPDQDDESLPTVSVTLTLAKSRNVLEQ